MSLFLKLFPHYYIMCGQKVKQRNPVLFSACFQVVFVLETTKKGLEFRSGPHFLLIFFHPIKTAHAALFMV